MRPLGRQFGWLWAAYAVSTFGTCLAFDAFPLIAILMLATPLLLPRRDRVPQHERDLVPSRT
jgi:hypothetical protein